MRRVLLPLVIASVMAAAIASYLFLQKPVLALSQAQSLPIDPVPLVAETKRGDKSFTIEIADDPGERESGLMHREDMEANHGMLFVFERPQMVGFWMKDTPMPLDLLFVGQDGRVKAIKQGEPFSEALISPGEPVRFVLELKSGTSAQQGIANGDMLRHPAINEAPLPGSGG